MKIWMLSSCNQVDVTLVNEANQWVFDILWRGEEHSDKWNDVKVNLSGDFTKCDFPYFSMGIPVFTGDAVRFLEHFLEG